MRKDNRDFINTHKKGCINAASVLMCIIIAGIVVCMTSCGKKDRQEVTEPSNNGERTCDNRASDNRGSHRGSRGGLY